MGCACGTEVFTCSSSELQPCLWNQIGFSLSSFCLVLNNLLLCSVFIQEKYFFNSFYILGFHKVMEGIHKATELGYHPVKVKPVFIYSGTVVCYHKWW